LTSSGPKQSSQTYLKAVSYSFLHSLHCNEVLAKINYSFEHIIKNPNI